MVGRKRTPGAEPPPPSLTAHQIVAYNFARARDALGWTQVETSERLEPFLGYKLNQAGISAIERTYDSDRRRNIDVAEIVAFARCFNVPLGWFFLPPATHAQDLIEPINVGDGEWANAPVAELIALAIGTPQGWPPFVARLAALLDTDAQAVGDALHYAFRGDRDEHGWEKQIDLRRRALMATTLARRATPGDTVITEMAALLVDLVKLTPIGYHALREASSEEALELLARGDQDVQTLLTSAQQKRRAGERRTSAYDDLEPIDPAEVLGLRDQEVTEEA